MSTSAAQSRADGLRLVREANALRAHARVDSTRKAILAYQRAAVLYRRAGDLKASGQTLVSAAETLAEISQFDRAIATYKEALRITRAIGDVDGEFAATNGLASTFFELGEPAATAASAKRAREIADKLAQPVSHAEALITTGRAHFIFSEDAAALADFREALEICRLQGDLACEANALEGISWTYSDTGDLPSAIVFEKRAMSLWERIGNRRATARAERMLGTFYSWIGDRDQALALHHKTQRIFHESGDRLWDAWALLALGEEYSTLDSILSLNYQRRALGIFQTIGHRFGQRDALGDLCRMYQSMQQPRRALEICRERYRISRDLGDPRTEAIAAAEVGLLLQELGELPAAMHEYELALQLSRTAADPRGQGDILRYMGTLRLSQGRPEEALTLFLQAAEFSQRGNDPDGEAAARGAIARAYFALGDFTRARQTLEAAISLAESLRERAGSPMLRSAYFASVRSYYEQYIDILMRLHKGAPDHGLDVLAFEASERSRARSLLDFVSMSRLGESADSAEVKDKALQVQIERKVRQLESLSPRDSRRPGLEVELRELQAQSDELVAASRFHAPIGSQELPHVITLPEIQNQLLDENTTFLEYALGERQGYIWAISKDSFTSKQLPSRKKIEAVARDLRELLTAPQPKIGEEPAAYAQRVRAAEVRYWKVAGYLTNILLPATRLKGHRLVISTEGVLEYIPFAALPEPGNSSDHPPPLGAKFEVVTLPSASILAVLRKPRETPAGGHNVLVFADPVFDSEDPRIKNVGRKQDGRQPDAQISELGIILRSAGLAPNGRLPRLPGTRHEAEAILNAAGSSRAILDFDANLRAATAADLKNYQILHFATHGILYAEHPELSGIILSLVDRAGRRQDGYLRVYRVSNLKLSADLVVLSACNSALGRHMTGEGVIGLNRAFFLAGAKRVVSSLWKVDDEVTSNLMSLFYKGMLLDGKTPAAALHDAQIEIAKRARWNYPYYWAAFVLQGDWR